MTQLNVASLAYWCVAAGIVAWQIWLVVRTYRNLPGQARKRQQRLEREAFAAAQRSPEFTLENARKAFSGVRRRYVTFTSTGIYVDIERYLKTAAGKAALERIDRSRS